MIIRTSGWGHIVNLNCDKMSLKEQYWRYSLVAIILLLGILIFFQILPFFSGILGAMTIYILLRNQMLYLTEKKSYIMPAAASTRRLSKYTATKLYATVYR